MYVWPHQIEQISTATVVSLRPVGKSIYNKFATLHRMEIRLRDFRDSLDKFRIQVSYAEHRRAMWTRFRSAMGFDKPIYAIPVCHICSRSIFDCKSAWCGFRARSRTAPRRVLWIYA